jgi:pimeloyl-ACP methyl ester carboxylesterase
MWQPLKLVLLLGASTSSALRILKRQSEPTFDWSSIEPTRELNYHPCYDGHKCARLKIPLDWTKNCSSKDWVAIGITTLPATVSEDDDSFGGTVLINPGGPGGAGTEMVLDYGPYLQAILEGDRHYEMLGFDPRGVGSSTPSADCYGDELKRAADRLQSAALPPVVSGEQGLAYHYQAAKGLGDLCAEKGPKSIFNYMSTASVAKDMLEIIERVDDLRYNTTVATRNDRDASKLQYIGVSYGTVLGNTFASMFPERIGRIVLDGVADAEDFVSGVSQTTSAATGLLANGDYCRHG